MFFLKATQAGISHRLMPIMQSIGNENDEEEEEEEEEEEVLCCV